MRVLHCLCCETHKYIIVSASVLFFGRHHIKHFTRSLYDQSMAVLVDLVVFSLFTLPFMFGGKLNTCKQTVID